MLISMVKYTFSSIVFKNFFNINYKKLAFQCFMCNFVVFIFLGSDVSVYLPDTTKGSSSGFKCSCAFSAAVNRRFGYNSGLFYEDEVEITGFRHELFDHRKAPLVQMDLPKNNGDSSSKSEDITPQVKKKLRTTIT